MYKTEKRAILDQLKADFMDETNLDRLIDLRRQIYAEVLSAGYKSPREIEEMIEVFSIDIGDYIQASRKGQGDILKAETELSLSGLTKLVEISLLPE